MTKSDLQIPVLASNNSFFGWKNIRYYAELYGITQIFGITQKYLVLRNIKRITNFFKNNFSYPLFQLSYEGCIGFIGVG
jgi:hypothetical protein